MSAVVQKKRKKIRHGKNKTFTPLMALISILHFKDTYLHPGVLGLTDIVEIDERLEDIGVGQTAKGELAQRVVD